VHRVCARLLLPLATDYSNAVVLGTHHYIVHFYSTSPSLDLDSLSILRDNGNTYSRARSLRLNCMRGLDGADKVAACVLLTLQAACRLGPVEPPTYYQTTRRMAVRCTSIQIGSEVSPGSHPRVRRCSITAIPYDLPSKCVSRRAYIYTSHVTRARRPLFHTLSYTS